MPALRRGVRRQFDATRNTAVLLAPERVIVLDDVADANIGECNATATVQKIIESLASRYATAPEDIAADIINFLQDLVDKGLVTA
jgi:pyrroloquinoline quinone biosynthesis protein D